MKKCKEDGLSDWGRFWDVNTAAGSWHGFQMMMRKSDNVVRHNRLQSIWNSKHLLCQSCGGTPIGPWGCPPRGPWHSPRWRPIAWLDLEIWNTAIMVREKKHDEKNWLKYLFPTCIFPHPNKPSHWEQQQEVCAELQPFGLKVLGVSRQSEGQSVRNWDQSSVGRLQLWLMGNSQTVLFPYQHVLAAFEAISIGMLEIYRNKAWYCNWKATRMGLKCVGVINVNLGKQPSIYNRWEQEWLTIGWTKLSYQTPTGWWAILAQPPASVLICLHILWHKQKQCARCWMNCQCRTMQNQEVDRIVWWGLAGTSATYPTYQMSKGDWRGDKWQILMQVSRVYSSYLLKCNAAHDWFPWHKVEGHEKHVSELCRLFNSCIFILKHSLWTIPFCVNFITPCRSISSSLHMSGNNPYFCVCQHYSCNLSKHEVKGVGTVCGRVLSRQVYQEHQRKETQRIAKKKQEQINPQTEQGIQTTVSSSM